MKNLINRMIGSSVIRYLFFGVCTTLVNLAFFFVLTHLHVETNISNVISVILAILFAYVVNSRYVFMDPCETLKDHIKPFVKFISARLVTMVIEVGGLPLLMGLFHLGAMPAKIATQFVVIVLNYIFSKVFVFTSGKEH